MSIGTVWEEKGVTCCTCHSSTVVHYLWTDPGKPGNLSTTVVSEEKYRYASLTSCTYSNVNFKRLPSAFIICD